MDSWRVAVLGDGGVGKTALAVQVSALVLLSIRGCCIDVPQFTLNCFVGEHRSVELPEAAADTVGSCPCDL